MQITLWLAYATACLWYCNFIDEKTLVNCDFTQEQGWIDVNLAMKNNNNEIKSNMSYEVLINWTNLFE